MSALGGRSPRRAAAGVTIAAAAVTAATTALSAPAEAAAAHIYRGAVAQTPYGPVAVKIRVVGSTVTRVSVTSFPTADRHSAQLSAYAIPRLRQQALAAQAASIAGVSGASYTSAAFERSLQSALSKAGIS